MATATPPLEKEARAIDSLAQEYGGKDEIEQLLLHLEDSDPGINKLLALMLDPAQDGKSLGLICKEARISFSQVMRAIQKGQGAKAIRRGMAAVYDRVSQVMVDVADSAVVTWKVCGNCKGDGWLPAPRPGEPLVACMNCDTSGKISFTPELARQKLALELGGVLGKPRGGPHSGNLQVNVPVSVSQSNRQAVQVSHGMTSALEMMKASSARVLYGVKTTAELREATPVEVLRPAAQPEAAEARPQIARPVFRRRE